MPSLSSLRHRLTRRLRALFHRATLERELDEELRFHLDMEVEHLVSQGLSPEEARARALRDFGGVARVKDAARDARGVHVLEDAGRDLRLAVRSLLRSPAYTLVALLTLSLGIGATVAVFSVVNATLLRPLSFPDAGHLVALHERSREHERMAFAGANFLELRQASRALALTAFYAQDFVTVPGSEGAKRARVARVSHGFFDVLGVRPRLGRTFTPEEGGAGKPAAIVVSHRFWRDMLGGDPSWPGRMLRLGSGEAQVAGVMPPDFAWPPDVDVWQVAVDDNPHRTAHNWSVVGRLRPGASPDAARAELDAHFSSLKAELGKDIDAEGVTVTPLHAHLTRDARTPLLVLLGAVALVLLVACVNLTSAGLARAESRHRELAIRAALGAGRERLVRQLLAESLLLSLVGGALGVGLAVALTHLFLAGTAGLPDFSSGGVDGRVLGFAVAVSVLTGLVVGGAPALHVTHDLRGAMARGGSTLAGEGRLRSRGVLIGAEVALALVLLVGAGLLVKSLRALLDVDPGFRPERVLMAEVTLPESLYRQPGGPYGDPERVSGLLGRLLPALRELPGVESVGLINHVPLRSGRMNSGFMLDGGTEVAGQVHYRVVEGDYFATLGIPLLRGRGLSGDDRAGAPHVVLINRAMAERYWPGADPLGHRLRLPGMDAHTTEWMTIVGVVGNVRQVGLDATPEPQLFVPAAQRPERLLSGATLLLRASVPLATLMPAVREQVRLVDPNIPVELAPMASLVDASVATRKQVAALLTGFAALALFLAAVGIYGVLAFSVARRRKELGIRMALGARPGAVRAMVLREALRAVLPGIAAGLLGAVALTHLLRGLLYGVSETDPGTFAGVALVLTGVAVAASWIPSRRATRVDPMVALRGD